MAAPHAQDPGAGWGKGATLILRRVPQVPSPRQGSDSATQKVMLVGVFPLLSQAQPLGAPSHAKMLVAWLRFRMPEPWEQ